MSGHGGKREGAGRPQKHDHPVRVTIVIPKATLERIDALASLNKCSRSEIVYEAMELLADVKQEFSAE